MCRNTQWSQSAGKSSGAGSIPGRRHRPIAGLADRLLNPVLYSALVQILLTTNC